MSFPGSDHGSVCKLGNPIVSESTNLGYVAIDKDLILLTRFRTMTTV
jgi:hypothetical protein